VIEVLPEAACSKSLLEIGIRGADEADVDRLGSGASEAADDPVLDDGEELRLGRIG
jgi:hypothetical protein